MKHSSNLTFFLLGGTVSGIYAPLNTSKELKMTVIAITCTVFIYSVYFIEAYKAYKRGDESQRPKPWLK